MFQIHIIDCGEKENAWHHLDLADQAVLDRVRAARHLLDLLAERLRDQLLHQVAEHALARLLLHDLDHLLTDLADLRGAGVARVLHLLLAALGERHAEHAQDVAIRRLHLR